MTKIVKIIGLAGLAGSAYAVINSASYDDEIDDIVLAVDVANAESDPAQRKVALLVIVGQMNQYLNHFDASDATDIVTVTTMYDMLGQDDW